MISGSQIRMLSSSRIMLRTTDATLGELDKERNRLISKLRSPFGSLPAVIREFLELGDIGM
jgi:hypothetical protein